MGMQGHNVTLGVQDEINTFFQPELPIAEAALDEHKRLTGHSPVEVENGWVCTEMAYDHEHCMASWPPPTPFERKMESGILGVLRDGKARIEGINYTFDIDFGRPAA